MINTKKLRLCVGVVVLSLFMTGCASPYLIKKKQKTLVLKQNEGVALFSCKFRDKDKPTEKNIFNFASIGLQENNQYKAYKQKQIFLIPLSGENYVKQDDLFLFSLKLPKGTYRVTNLNGVFRVLFGSQYFASINKLFDVLPGQVSYAGRVCVDFFVSKGRKHELKVEDQFAEDKNRFKNGYPALQNQTIVKDLIY